MQELGPDVPVHFTAFHPDYKMDDLPPTPPATLTRARKIAEGLGLRYVYTGNVHDTAGGTTHCPGCGNAVIVRDWHRILNYRVTDDGKCKECGAPLVGHFEKFGKPFGQRRIPVRLANFHAA
jgi:pyruvate formate lyase activating enzyme